MLTSYTWNIQKLKYLRPQMIWRFYIAAGVVQHAECLNFRSKGVKWILREGQRSFLSAECIVAMENNFFEWFFGTGQGFGEHLQACS